MSNLAKRGVQNQPSKTPTVEGDKYTVLLLDEDQLDRFLNRSSLKTLGSQLAHRGCVAARAPRRIWATAAAVVVLALTSWLRAATEAVGRRAPRAAS